MAKRDGLVEITMHISSRPSGGRISILVRTPNHFSTDLLERKYIEREVKSALIVALITVFGQKIKNKLPEIKLEIDQYHFDLRG